IIEEVRNLKSELGIIYMSEFNRKVIQKLLADNDLRFHPLFHAEAHVFISDKHPLASKSLLDNEDLDDFPCLAFEQGEYNSFYFAEEILSTRTYKKKILVSDRATLFSLLIGLNGYTISSGVLNKDLNGQQIKSVRLRTNETILIGYIVNSKANLSNLAVHYVEKLTEVIMDFGYSIIK